MLISYFSRNDSKSLTSVRRTRLSLILGFASVIALMITLFVFRTYELQTAKEHIDRIAQNHLTKIDLVINMRAAAQERTLSLQRMLLETDPFLRDQEWIHFNQMGAEFARSRLQILGMELDEDEKTLLDYQGNVTKEALEVQKRVVELIENDKMNQAREVLLKHMIPTKDQVISQLNTFYRYQENQAGHIANETTKVYEEMRSFIWVVSIIACLLAVAIATYVIRRATNTERVLSSAYSNIQKQSEEKSQFLADVIDEYRTPLNSLMQYSDSIAQNANTQDKENKRFMADVSNLQKACYHLNGLTAEIMDLTKVESGKVSLLSIEFDIYKLARDVVDQTKTIAAKNNNQIEVECSIGIGSMCSDPNKIRQILFNLLANACKYTEFGIITLSVKKESNHPSDDTDWITFSVKDTGIGIPPEKVQKIFSSSQNISRPNHAKFEDSGLSLSISRRICHMMSGEITVNSEPGMGSEFSIRLPSATITAPEAVF